MTLLKIRVNLLKPKHRQKLKLGIPTYAIILINKTTYLFSSLGNLKYPKFGWFFELFLHWKQYRTILNFTKTQITLKL